MAAREDTVFFITVNEPGGNVAIAANIIQDALYQSIKEDNTTDATNLQLAIVNAPIISNTERQNALRIRLHNTLVNEVSIEEYAFAFLCKSLQVFHVKASLHKVWFFWHSTRCSMTFKRGNES